MTKADVQEYLLNCDEAEGGRLWCKQIIAGVKVRDRTCLRLYAEAMEWAGAETHIGTLMIQQIGVTLPEAKLAVAAVEEANAKDEHALAREAVKFLEDYRQRNPGQWELLKGSLCETR